MSFKVKTFYYPASYLHQYQANEEDYLGIVETDINAFLGTENPKDVKSIKFYNGEAGNIAVLLYEDILP